MGLKATKGKKYHIDKIYPRHFLIIAKQVGFNQQLMSNMMQEIKGSTERIINDVKEMLQIDFPLHISEGIFSGMRRQLAKL